jgi:hypothetical protein
MGGERAALVRSTDKAAHHTLGHPRFMEKLHKKLADRRRADCRSAFSLAPNEANCASPV